MRHQNVSCIIAVLLVGAGCGGTVKSRSDAGDVSTDGTPDTAGDVPVDGGDPGTDDPGTDPSDPCASHPGDTCVVLEHEGEAEDVLVDFHIDVDSADFYLLIDTTGSMDASITDVAAAFTSEIRPAALASFADVRFGLGHFNDFPEGEYGQSNDMPYWHMLDVGTDMDAVQTELDTLPGNDTWGNGGDLPEANVVALTIVATGLGLDVGGATIPDQDCSGTGSFGYPCFRPDALPVVIMVSDASWHNGEGGSDPYSFTTHTWDDAVAAFTAAGIKYMGVNIPYGGSGGTVDGLTPMQHFATATGSLDADGNPLVSTGPASTAGERAASLIDTLREQARFDVACVAEDEPDDPPGANRDATVFVRSMAPESATPPTGMPDPTMDETTFHDALQGTDLTFRVTLQNLDHPSTGAPVTSTVWIVALGDGTTEIGRERIVVIVP